MKKFNYTSDYIKIAKWLNWDPKLYNLVEEPLFSLDVYFPLDKTNKEHLKFAKLTKVNIRYE